MERGTTVLEPDSVWSDGQVGKGFPADGSQFGRSVATGDVTGDGFDDLVVGSPGTGGSPSCTAARTGSPRRTAAPSPPLTCPAPATGPVSG
ncbi:FG-GAP repeat protein [Kineococcus sp. SYSU DK001]|uniref:FG-GAP repeat protein n=1 Tax=Kineococcus sp. SYSU DK001 TaxID=3383122 RepID=UPI003D7CF644